MIVISHLQLSYRFVIRKAEALPYDIDGYTLGVGQTFRFALNE